MWIWFTLTAIALARINTSFEYERVLLGDRMSEKLLLCTRRELMISGDRLIENQEVVCGKNTNSSVRILHCIRDELIPYLSYNVS